MSLAELGGRLEIGDAGDVLLGGLTSALTGLEGLDVPDAAVDVQVSSPAGTEDLSLSLQGTTAAITGVVGTIPAPGASLARLDTALGVVLGEPGQDDLATRLGVLLGELGGELEAGPESGFLAVLERLSERLGSSPETAALNALLSSLLEAAGAGANPTAALAEAVPALAGTVRGLGAAMSMESTLTEGERLARLMAAQLDAERVELELSALRNAAEVGPFSLDRLEAAGASPGEPLLDDALEAARHLSVRLGAVSDLLARSMGFGEATLVRMDPALLTRKVQTAVDALAGVDVDVIARAMERLMAPLRPVLEGAGLPSLGDSLDEVLTLLEGHVAELAAAVEAAEVERVAEPVAAGFETVNGALRDVSGAVETVIAEVRAALEAVRQAVAGLPLDEIAARVRTVLDPAREAMETAARIVGEVEAALAGVAAAATGGLEDAEAAIVTFQETVDGALEDAADFVVSLDLDGAVGRVGDLVNGFAETLGQAEVKPYFDTAVDGIETTADVIDAVPLELLPEDMKADLDAAVAPIRAIDVDAAMEEVKGWFQIRDGEFALKDPLLEAVSDIADQHAALMQEIEAADPRQLVAPLDAAFADVRAEVERLVPELSLAPLEEGIAAVRGALDGLDLRAELEPVDAAFRTVLDAIDAYSPERLIQPLEERVDEARTRLTGLVRLEEWEPLLDQVEARTLGLLDRADPDRLEEAIRKGLGEATRLLDTLDRLPLERAFGTLISSLLRGTGLGVREWSVDSLARWLGGASGADQLTARAGAIHDAVRATRDAVAGVDLAALRRDLDAVLARFRSAVQALPAGAQRDEILAVLAGIRPDGALVPLEANRARYLASLDRAVADADLLARRGLSQVDVTLRELQGALSPATAIQELFTDVLGLLGIRRSGDGLTATLRDALAVATPERIAGIVVPLARAVRGRLVAFLETLLTPVRAGIAELRSLIAALDLTPLREGVAAVVEEVKREVAALSPTNLLGDLLDAYDALRTELQGFDPLAPVRAVVDALRAVADRLLGLLDAESLLRHPIRIYDEVAGAVAALDVEALLTPILDRLDALAAQVGDGIDETADALEALQDALPAPGGGSSVSVSVSAA